MLVLSLRGTFYGKFGGPALEIDERAPQWPNPCYDVYVKGCLSYKGLC